MKTTLIHTAAVLLAGFPAPATGQSYGTHYEWQFRSSTTPSAPEVVQGSAGTPLATITPDPIFAVGWLAGKSFLGSAQGIWDLGREGSVTLTDPCGLGGSADPARSVTVSVVQYEDGGIYAQLARVSVPGATPVGARTRRGSAASGLGNWMVSETEWRADAGVPVDSVVITGAPGGSLIDQVAVDSVPVVTQPSLTIRKAGAADTAQVEISWPSNYGHAVLESSADLHAPSGWSAVDAAVQETNGTSFVTLEVVRSAQFYRLKLP